MPKDKDEELQRLNEELLEEDIAPEEEAAPAAEADAPDVTVDDLLSDEELNKLLDVDSDGEEETAAEETPAEKPDRTIKFLSILALCLLGGILLVLGLLLWEFRGLLL